MLPSGRWLLLIFYVCAFGTPALSQSEAPSASNFVQRLYQSVLGKHVAVVLDIPECLIDLTGGVTSVEETLAQGVQEGYKWAILVTTSGERSSMLATQKFYEVVSTACSPTSDTTPDSSDSTLESFDDAAQEQHDFTNWKFAYMSFEGEPDLIWRWWIWKVPSMVFVSSPTQEKMPFDMRFWKIAFEQPSVERILDVIGYGMWKNINVWESSLAPGGSLELLPYGFARVFGLFYKVLDPIPTWLLAVLASIFGSTLISQLHGSGN